MYNKCNQRVKHMMSDTILDKPVVDTYKEHARHTKYRFDCSTCHVARQEENKKRKHISYNSINSEITVGSHQRFNNPLER